MSAGRDLLMRLQSLKTGPPPTPLEEQLMVGGRGPLLHGCCGPQLAPVM